MELWDILDENGSKTGRTIVRGCPLKEGEYHQVVHIWIVNDAGELLIQKRADNIPLWPGKWAATGGSAIAGEDSFASAVREVKEELGIQIHRHEMEFIERIKRGDTLTDLWLVRKNVEAEEIRVQVEEVSEAKWVSRERLLAMVKTGDFVGYSYIPELLAKIDGQKA